MAKQQHREAAGRATRVTVVQAALVGLVLLALGWSWQRPAAPVPQQLPAGPKEPYITDLVLPLDVGTLAQQAEADAWCSTRTQLSWPPTPQQLRSLRVAIVVDPVCRQQEYVSGDALAKCLDAIVSHCKDLAKTGCFGGWSGKLEECKGVLPSETLPDGTKPPQKWNHYQFWWQTIMTKAAPELRAMGWSNLKILSDAKSANERRMASCADLLITSTTMFWQLYPFKHGMRPHQKMILIEQYGAGTFMLPPDMEAGVESNNTIAIVKHVLVDPPSKQNGPFLEERSHLALMVQDRPDLLTVRERPWQQTTLDKMEVLLPMTVRFANPIQCGGSWGFVRYHGFFTKNENRWPIPPLASRPYDVTFIGKLEYEAKAEVSGVTLHRQAAVKALSAFRDKWGHQYKMYVPQGERLEYHEYVGLLKQSKIVISPWGWGEWSHKDFEILMAGCVVVKPRSDIFRIHPAIFEHNVTAITTKEDLSDLEEQILPFLRDVPRAQAMATRVQGLWRQYARADQLAKDWDELMLRRLGASIKDDLRQQYEGLGGGLELGGEPAGQESLPPPGAAQQPLGQAEQERQAEEAEEEGEPDEAGDSKAADAQQAEQAQQAGQAQQVQQSQQAQQAQREERVVLLRNPPRRFVRPVQRTQKLLGMVQVLCASIGLTGVFYCLVGMFGYLEFPTSAMSNILLNYSDKDRLMALARVLVGIIQIVHYPVNHFPARNAIRDLLAQLTGRSFEGWRFNTAEVLAFYAATLVLSLLVSDLGQVFKLIGGSTGAFFIFMMPGAFLIQYAYNKHLHLREGAWEPLLADGDEEAEAGSSAAGTAAAGATTETTAAAGSAAGAVPQRAQRAQRGARRPEEYHVLGSKLFWAGCVLQLAGLGLLALTIYTLLAPPI